MRQGRFARELPLYMMILPGVILVLIYSYIPMFGIIMAFQKFSIVKGFFGSEWVGLRNFDIFFHMPNFWRVLRNTVSISLMKIIAGLIFPVAFALLLNETKSRVFKRTVQTMVYLPHFLSWVMLAGIFVEVLSPSTGLVNQIIKGVGLKPIFFLGDPKYFPFTAVVTDIWKSFGYQAIIYMAALTNINPELYESAIIDGANRWKQTRYITIPGIMPIVIMMTALSLGYILQAGVDQILNLYSVPVYKTGDIIDTLVYRTGIIDGELSLSTAVGLFMSVVSMIFIISGRYIADKCAGYRIF